MKKLVFVLAFFFPAVAYAQNLNLSRLDVAIRAANIPIDGVSGLVCGSPNAARIDFKPEATAQQRTDATSILAAFDCSPAAQQTYEDGKEPDLVDLLNQAAAAKKQIDDYLAIADSATNVQVRAEVKANDQRQRKIIVALERIIRKMLNR